MCEYPHYSRAANGSRSDRDIGRMGLSTSNGLRHSGEVCDGYRLVSSGALGAALVSFIALAVAASETSYKPSSALLVAAMGVVLGLLFTVGIAVLALSQRGRVGMQMVGLLLAFASVGLFSGLAVALLFFE